MIYIYIYSIGYNKLPIGVKANQYYVKGLVFMVLMIIVHRDKENKVAIFLCRMVTTLRISLLIIVPLLHTLYKLDLQIQGNGLLW